MALVCTDCPLEDIRNAIPLSLSKNKPYTIVTKPPSVYDVQKGNVMPRSYGNVLTKALTDSGFKVNKDFNIIPCVRCAYDKDIYTTKQKSRIAKTCRVNMQETLAHLDPDVIVPLGADATSAVNGKKVMITKVRGVPSMNEEFNTVVLPILDPAIVNIRVDNAPLFASDVQSLVRLVESDLSLSDDGTLFGNYSYIDDIGFIVDADPDLLCVDCETEGFNYGHDDTRLLTIQFCYEAGTAYTVSWDHPDSILSDRKKAKLVSDLRKIVQAGTEFTGHNFKFDKLWVNAKIGVDIPISHDSLLLYSLINENSYDKSLSTLTKMYVPTLAGYDDQFNLEVDKSKMVEYPLDTKWLNYGSADVDSCFQVTNALLDIVEQDRALYNYYNRVTIPGINAFAEMEKDGITVDVTKLHAFRGMLSSRVLAMRSSLLDRIPRSIRRKHMKLGLSFSRAVFLRDILFDHKDGFRFKPQVFTDTTKNLPDKSMRVASTSTKQHLPYFLPHSFVADLIEYIKLERMLGTNVVNYEANFIHPDGKLWPTHFLSTAVTGRVAAKNPNVMNAPSRGELAKPYKEIFSAPSGMAVVAADLSQAELRVIAHEAREPTMIGIYNSGGDIHARTAAEVMSLSLDEFYSLAPDVIAEKRFGAKGVNFGFVYGLMAKSYVSYAKTQYGIEVTLEESEIIRDRYFKTYGGLLRWHERRESEVRKHKQVRSLFGRLRHLPQIDSDDFMTQLEAVRQAINSGIQGVGSDLGVMSLSRILKEINKDYLYPRNFIHDAIYSYAPLEYVSWASIALKYYMESNDLFEAFELDFAVPIVAEPEVGTSQGTLVEVKTPFVHIDEITKSDIEYIYPHFEELEKKGLYLPDQKIPPNMGKIFKAGRRR